MNKKVAIIYLCWSDEPYKYLEEALDGISKQAYDRASLELVVIYNSHKADEQSALDFIKNKTEERIDKLPHTTILAQTDNLGFVGGNNVGMQWAIDNDCDYVFLHNADGSLESSAIGKLVDQISADNVGAVQSLMLLDPERELINNAGNNFQYLGFGYCNMYRKKRELLDNECVQVGYVSGAAVMMKVDLLKQYGLLDNDLFIYHDDLEYGLRLRSLGYQLLLVPDSIFYHKYKFSRNTNKYYLMERNRYAVMLMYFKWPTLILLMPMAIILEIGLIFFSLQGGWLMSKLRAYGYWLNIRNWSKWLKKRKMVQSRRVRSDSYIFSKAVGGVVFDDIDNWLLHYIGNPILSTYFYIIKLFIFW